MMTNIMEVKKPEPIRLDMALLKPPPKPIQQFQPVHKTVVEQQRVERQEFEKEVSKKEIVDNEIVEQQIEMNNVSKQEVVDQTLVKQETLTEQRTKQTTAEREMVQVTDTVETQVPQQQRVTSQAVPRVAAATPVTSAVSVKPVSNAYHRPVATVANHRQVATIAQPMVKGDRQVKDDRQVKRPSTVQDVPVVSVEKTTTTEFTTQQILASIKKVAAISSGSVSKSTARVHHTPTQRSTAAKVVSKIQATKSLAIQSAPRQVIEETALTKIQPPVITREIEQSPFVVTDYNWIADTLSEKVQRLKRYPTRAKRRMWEGTVELRVSIRANGEIQDVHVLESSGHRILDQDALKTVRLASPLTLNHLVDRPMVMIDLPIVYELN